MDRRAFLGTLAGGLVAAPEDAAKERLNAIPSFARGMVVKGVEAYARSSGRSVITRDLLQEVREKWGARFRPMG